jgi:hypothetical protein
MIARRRILLGLLAAPMVVKTPGLLMPIKPVTPVSFGGLISTSAGLNIGDLLVIRCGDKETWMRVVAAAGGADVWLAA